MPKSREHNRKRETTEIAKSIVVLILSLTYQAAVSLLLWMWPKHKPTQRTNCNCYIQNMASMLGTSSIALLPSRYQSFPSIHSLSLTTGTSINTHHLFFQYLHQMLCFFFSFFTLLHCFWWLCERPISYLVFFCAKAMNFCRVGEFVSGNGNRVLHLQALCNC